MTTVLARELDDAAHLLEAAAYLRAVRSCQVFETLVAGDKYGETILVSVIDNEEHLLRKPFRHAFDSDIVYHKKLDFFHILEEGRVSVFTLGVEGLLDSGRYFPQVHEKDLDEVVFDKSVADCRHGVSFACSDISPEVETPPSGGVGLPVVAV